MSAAAGEVTMLHVIVLWVRFVGEVSGDRAGNLIGALGWSASEADEIVRGNMQT
jgi:hypothetical protein